MQRAIFCLVGSKVVGRIVADGNKVSYRKLAEEPTLNAAKTAVQKGKYEQNFRNVEEAVAFANHVGIEFVYTFDVNKEEWTEWLANTGRYQVLTEEKEPKDTSNNPVSFSEFIKRG